MLWFFIQLIVLIYGIRKVFEWIPETRLLIQRLFTGFFSEVKREALEAVTEVKKLSSELTQDYSLPIGDNYESLEDVKKAIRKAGVESCELMVFVDFTKSNEHQGNETFGGLNLHDISQGSNPYVYTIDCISQTLSEFDDDNMVPFCIFGDTQTADRDVRCIVPKRPKDSLFSLDNLTQIYKEQLHDIKMSGPTSFTPCIKQAIKNFQRCDNPKYYIVLIVTDGETMTPDEDKRAFIEASMYPLSFVIVGVGDGPFNAAKEFDDMIGRKFDNVQFVEYAKIANKGKHREPLFALNTLMEIPEQYQAIKHLGYLKRRRK